MSRGFICIAQNTGDVDYLRAAYALALSIKLSQTTNAISVCVDEHTRSLIKAKHKRVFDHIIDIPWGDAAHNVEWKVHNKWKYLYMTPYDETIVLDADMLFPNSIDLWWDILAQQDMWFTTQVRTFRNELVTSDFYRDVFTKNNLPNIYTGLFYFKQSALASEVFTMTEIVFQHWQRFFYKYLPNGKPSHLSGDVAYALAIQLLGVQHLCIRENVDAVPTFVHMKSHIQNSQSQLHDDWTMSIPTYFTSYNNFKIGNFTQLYPFHYVDKNWLTDEMITSMERLYYGNS